MTTTRWILRCSDNRQFFIGGSRYRMYVSRFSAARVFSSPTAAKTAAKWIDRKLPKKDRFFLGKTWEVVPVQVRLESQL